MFSNILLLDTTIGCCGCNWLCWWWLLWTGVAMLLGCLLCRWITGSRYKDEIDRLTRERDGYHTQFTNAEKDLASLKYQLDEANKEITRLKGMLMKCEADNAALIAQANSGDGVGTGLGIGDLGDDGATDRGDTGYAAILGTDNLQIVEGVGPKIEGLLKADGINNWADFANTSVEKLQAILDAAGSRYKLANPKTWPEQARLAHEGKWDDLIKYQKFLDSGVETKGDFDSPAKVEKLLAKLMGFSTNPNDLKVVEGIGPKIEGLLKADGINTWSDLAGTSEDRLREILKNAGDRYRLADPTTWAKQAGMAANGEWDALKEYQDFLSGGKNPG